MTNSTATRTMDTTPTRSASARPFSLEPLPATFGAVVRGLRLADLDEATFAALYDAWLEYALLVFPDQHLSQPEQVAFANRFGPPEFALAPISNVMPDGSIRDEAQNDVVTRLLKGNQGWHADSTYVHVQAKAAVFTAHVVPAAGGETAWADMRAAYAALDPATRARVEALTAYHSIAYSQRRMGLAIDAKGDEKGAGNDGGYSGYGFEDKAVPRRPLVKIHPETGRPSLLIGRHAHAIPGLDPAESEKLLDELVAFACQPPRTYQHTWTVGDAVVWDNRCLLHRGLPWNWKEARVMYHARIAGDPRSETALEV